MRNVHLGSELALCAGEARWGGGGFVSWQRSGSDGKHEERWATEIFFSLHSDKDPFDPAGSR